MATNLKRAGGWLLLIAAAAIVIGMILWSRASDQAHASELSNILAGRSPAHPDRLPATLALTVGGLSALTGIVLLAIGASPRQHSDH